MWCFQSCSLSAICKLYHNTIPSLWVCLQYITHRLVKLFFGLLRSSYPAPRSFKAINHWPHVLLGRACECWGEKAVKKQLRFLVEIASTWGTEHKNRCENQITRVYISYGFWFQHPLLYSTLRTGEVESFKPLQRDWMLPWSLRHLDSGVAARFGFQLDVAHALMVNYPKNVWHWYWYSWCYSFGIAQFQPR